MTWPPVDGPFAQGWPKSLRIKEDVDVLGKPLDRIPPLGEACTAFEDDDIVGDGAIARSGGDRAGGGADGAQSFRDVVVFLDDGRSQSLLAKALRGLQDRLLEIAMFKQLHSGCSFACQWRARGIPDSAPKSNFEKGLRDSRRRQRRSVLADLLAGRSQDRANARGFRGRNFQQTPIAAAF